MTKLNPMPSRFKTTTKTRKLFITH